MPDTIRVWVDDDELSDAQFAYDAPANTVTIDPPAGADTTVSIEYQIEP